MDKSGTKDAAEAILRDLPSVVGAFVREDVLGNPREVHLLIAPGPKPRLFARDVRDLLEERLGVPIDQRVISIAQLAANATPPAAAGTPAAADAAGAARAQPDRTGDDAATALTQPTRAEPRLRFEGVETLCSEGRLVVRVRVGLDDAIYLGEDFQVDAPHARVRSGARAVLDAANQVGGEHSRFALEEVGRVRALGRDYVLLTIVAHAAVLGRRPLVLAGAQPIEGEDEIAAALATLKAVNRVLALTLSGAG